MILEYKMDRNAHGNLMTPTWIESGGFLHNPDNFTMIGFSPAIRPYKIPDSALQLTVAQAKARSVAIHTLHPMSGMDGNALTDAQVEDMTQAIIDENDIA